MLRVKVTLTVVKVDSTSAPPLTAAAAQHLDRRWCQRLQQRPSLRLRLNPHLSPRQRRRLTRQMSRRRSHRLSMRLGSPLRRRIVYIARTTNCWVTNEPEPGVKLTVLEPFIIYSVFALLLSLDFSFVEILLFLLPILRLFCCMPVNAVSK